MQKIILIGNAISADIIHAYLAEDNRYEVVAFSVDKSHIKENTKMGLPVIATELLAGSYSLSTHKVIMAVGYSNLNKVRQELFKRVKEMGFTAETYIHPDAKIYNGGVDGGNIGEGSIIMPQTTLEVFTTIGENSVVWANCLIGHHSNIGDNCWLASGTVLAGETAVGDNTFLGVNVTISHQVKVAALNIIGSASAIHKDTRENEVYLSRQGEKHRFPATDYAQYFLK
ncbi:MAG: acetyltransferase [Gammaproteobacteria bacterium]|nr:acetyltransferase [Gammaproteobacteria bacterium]